MIGKIFWNSSFLFTGQASTPAFCQPPKHGLVAWDVGITFHRTQYFSDSIEGDFWSFLRLFLGLQSFFPSIQKLTGPTYSPSLFHPAPFSMIVQNTSAFVVGIGQTWDKQLCGNFSSKHRQDAVLTWGRPRTAGDQSGWQVWQIWYEKFAWLHNPIDLMRSIHPSCSISSMFSLPYQASSFQLIPRPVKDLESKCCWEEKSTKTNVSELVQAQVQVGQVGAVYRQLA